MNKHRAREPDNAVGALAAAGAVAHPVTHRSAERLKELAPL